MALIVDCNEGGIMQTTLKRIDITSAFRIGAVTSALLFAVFGLLFVLFQGLLLSGMRAAIETEIRNEFNFNGMFLGAGILGLLCFYGVGVVFAAIFGGIQFAVGAFCYNLAANWVGGVRIELERDDDPLNL